MTQISDAAHPIGGEPFQVGRALSRSFEVYGRGFGKFTLISFIVLVPILIIKVAGALSLPKEQAQLVTAVAGLLIVPLSIIVHGACMLGAFKTLRGESFNASESLGAAVRRFFPLLGVGLLVGLASMAGALLLIIPGVIVGVMFYVAGAVCVVEKAGVFDSLGRSRGLTSGYRWSIFGIFLLIMAISFVGGFGVVVMASAGAPYLVRAFVEFLWQVVAAGLGACVVGVVYHDLRVAQEGVDIEKLTNVFA